MVFPRLAGIFAINLLAIGSQFESIFAQSTSSEDKLCTTLLFTLTPPVSPSTAFAAADGDGDGRLTEAEADAALRCFFAQFDVAKVVARMTGGAREAFTDGGLTPAEFDATLWSRLLLPLSGGRGAAALLIDVQNDFISGSLALKNAPAGQDGASVIAPLNALLSAFPSSRRPVVYSLDWHPADHVSFLSNAALRPRIAAPTAGDDGDVADLSVLDTVTFAGPPPFNQTLWPDHCVQGTKGAELHPDLKVVETARFIRKGTNPDVDSYSAFFDNLGGGGGDTGLRAILRETDTRVALVAGLATDFCVGATALDALSDRVGVTAVVLSDASRGVAEAGVAAMRARVVDAGGLWASSEDIAALVAIEDRGAGDDSAAEAANLTPIVTGVLVAAAIALFANQ